MKKALKYIFWALITLIGLWVYLVLCLHRKEPISVAYLIIAALCSYAIGYRLYAKWIETKVLVIDNNRPTPAVAHEDGKDYVKTNKWVVFGHHFAAISGPGPLVGPVLAAQFGYLPGALWLLIGCVLAGGVHDFVVLFCSVRRDGRSLGQMIKEEINTPTGYVAMVAILSILVILLAALGLVVVRALAESPWGVFTVGATIPIALIMGTYMRYFRPGDVKGATIIGITLLLLAVYGGRLIYQNPIWGEKLTLPDTVLAWSIIVYGFTASVLPVWLLLAPRDYLSTFMKIGTILILGLGVLLVMPKFKLPPLTQFVDGTGPILAGKVFPFCFITIACGAISGFHALISSGTTPKLITKESHARQIGYGALCVESFVAIMALIAASGMDPGVYFAMNIKDTPEAIVQKVTQFGFPVTIEEMNKLANLVGEHTLFSRTGGAATLAVGMAQIFAKITNPKLLDLWYHFAIMFEALFILTTIDAGTRVGRYILQEFLGMFWKPLGDTRRLDANIVASGLMVGAWGYFLIQGVHDPLGGINTLWPLFGIANQMLAAIALCFGTTVILKMQLLRRSSNAQPQGKLWYCLVTFVPMVWLVAVTYTAGIQKIAHPNPRIGFLSQAKAYTTQITKLEAALSSQAVETSQETQQLKNEIHRLRTLRFNNIVDAVVASVFLLLVTLVLAPSFREWVVLLTHRRSPSLAESTAVHVEEPKRQ